MINSFAIYIKKKLTQSGRVVNVFCPTQSDFIFRELVVITDYKVRSMLHETLKEVVIVKRNMEENIEQGKMK